MTSKQAGSTPRTLCGDEIPVPPHTVDVVHSGLGREANPGQPGKTGAQEPPAVSPNNVQSQYWPPSCRAPKLQKDEKPPLRAHDRRQHAHKEFE